MWYLVAAVMVITVILVLVGSTVAVRIGRDGPAVDAGPNATMSVPVAVSLEARAPRVSAPSLGIDTAQLRDLRGTLRFPAHRDAFFASNLMLVMTAFGVLLWVLGELRAVFRTVGAGRPFVPENAARVRRIAWAVIVGEFVRSGIVFFENYYTMTHFVADGVSFDARPDFNVFAIVNGLIILAIAEVFRTGTRLDEDQSLTI